MSLPSIFNDLCRNYSTDAILVERLWDEIAGEYSVSQRHYHTLTHLENLVTELEEVKDKISGWNTVLFSVFYHDIIYESTATDNEEKSAALAKRRLTEIHVPEDAIRRCRSMILATKGHLQTGDSDTDHFTDADLSILGQAWNEYSTYLQQVRKEYAVYPDPVYKAGRKKVLDHFLHMDRIFKTDHFYIKFESTARENLEREKDLYLQ